MSESQDLPEWFQQLEERLPLARGLILYGNVADYLLYPQQDESGNLSGQYYPVRFFLDHYLKEKGYGLIGHYDLLDGLVFYSSNQLAIYRELLQKSEAPQSTGGQAYQVPGSDQPAPSQEPEPHPDPGLEDGRTPYSAKSVELNETFQRIRRVQGSSDCPLSVFIIYFSEDLTGSSQQRDLNERMNLILLQKIMEESSIKNNYPQLLIFVVDDVRKLPMALYFHNPRSKQVPIPRPDTKERLFFAKKFKGIFHKGREEAFESTHLENFATCTNELCNFDLENLGRLSRQYQIPMSQSKELVKRYKFGQKKSPWDTLSRDRLKSTSWKHLKKDLAGKPIFNTQGKIEYETVNLPFKDCLKERVIGQDHALNAVETMVMKAIEGGLSTKPTETLTKPKGIFLFAGPTGVGKTELTKALTEWLFGDETAMLRFDMSEYGQEHSDQKLIGAPPGYVGHEQGGQLTNTVRKKPFCVILFDEVDKMHRKIWDIFLQILDDGRLTDGTGETVYFSETVIIMTSNLGGAQQPFVDDPQTVRDHYLSAVKTFFRQELGRPEILNRIGMNNVVAFNSIGRDFQEQIIWQKLNGLSLSVLEKDGLGLKYDSSVIRFLIDDEEGFARNGARGIENLITANIVNPLTRYIFYQNQLSGKIVTVNIHKNSATRIVETTFNPT